MAATAQLLAPNSTKCWMHAPAPREIDEVHFAVRIWRGKRCRSSRAQRRVAAADLSPRNCQRCTENEGRGFVQRLLQIGGSAAHLVVRGDGILSHSIRKHRTRDDAKATDAMMRKRSTCSIAEIADSGRPPPTTSSKDDMPEQGNPSNPENTGKQRGGSSSSSSSIHNTGTLAASRGMRK